jgi:hypothetical protein
MARIIKKEGKKLIIEIDLELEGDMLSQEEAIQKALNEAGKIATKEAFENFDEDASSIEVDKKKLTKKGEPKKKQ